MKYPSYNTHEGRRLYVLSRGAYDKLHPGNNIIRYSFAAGVNALAAVSLLLQSSQISGSNLSYNTVADGVTAFNFASAGLSISVVVEAIMDLVKLKSKQR